MPLIKVLLIDDDKLIINDLCRITDWESNGFEIVSTAYNGKQGLLKCRQLNPQIIFTDIRMPIMDGLEMLQKIREKHTIVRFVILTAHSEFEYAKQAIDLGASAYILKNQITRESIEKILELVKGELLEHSYNSFWAIQNIVHSFIDDDSQDIDQIFKNLDEAFDSCFGGQDNWNLQPLIDSLSKLIKQAYQKYGKQSYFEHPQIDTWLACLEWTKKHLKMIGHWPESDHIQISPVISNAMIFIKRNFAHKDLNIQMIADGLSISPSWLSVLFKKEIGKTINDYITEVRIDEAKKLLGQGRHKIYEIADMVGYGSGRYFSKVFFQVTAQLPHHFGKDVGK